MRTPEETPPLVCRWCGRRVSRWSGISRPLADRRFPTWCQGLPGGRRAAARDARASICPEMDERLLTIGQVATVLGISRDMAYVLVERGDLAAIRIGPRCIRVRPSDLERYILSRRTPAVGER